jgi:hypothetical protein
MRKISSLQCTFFPNPGIFYIPKVARYRNSAVGAACIDGMFVAA